MKKILYCFVGIFVLLCIGCGKDSKTSFNFNDEFPKYESKEARLGSQDYRVKNELEEIVMNEIEQRKKGRIVTDEKRKYYVNDFSQNYEGTKKHYIEEIKKGNISEGMAANELEKLRLYYVLKRYEMEMESLFAEAFSYEILDSKFLGEKKGEVNIQLKKLKGIDLNEFQEKLMPIVKKMQEVGQKRLALTGGFRLPIEEREKLVPIEKEMYQIYGEILGVYHELYIREHIKNPSYETKEMKVELKKSSYSGKYELVSSYDLLKELDNEETGLFSGLLSM